MEITRVANNASWSNLQRGLNFCIAGVGAINSAGVLPCDERTLWYTAATGTVIIVVDPHGNVL
jgi:hypothetical protein